MAVICIRDAMWENLFYCMQITKMLIRLCTVWRYTVVSAPFYSPNWKKNNLTWHRQNFKVLASPCICRGTDKSPLDIIPVDKSPLLNLAGWTTPTSLKSIIKLLTLIRLLFQGKSHLQCIFTDNIISRVCCDKQLNFGVKSHLRIKKIILQFGSIGKHMSNFDPVVTISMHFYERCLTNRDVWNFRFKKILHLSIRPFVHQFNPIPVKCI